MANVTKTKYDCNTIVTLVGAGLVSALRIIKKSIYKPIKNIKSGNTFIKVKKVFYENKTKKIKDKR